MLDIHCHIVPGVDDGAANLDTAVAMGRVLVAAGFTTVAASPHYGEGPGGDVPMAAATAGRERVAAAFANAGVALELLPNAEHHIGATLFERVDRGEVVPIGGKGRWLLVELPWQQLAGAETALFRLQSKGWRLVLAHPERYSWLELDAIGRLCERGVKMQLEIGSFANAYGKRAQGRAIAMGDHGQAHILASDLHEAIDSARWLPGGLRVIGDRYGKRAVQVGAGENPRLLVADAELEQVRPWSAAR